MQIKVEKEPYSLKKAIGVYLLLFVLYFSVAIAPDLSLPESQWPSIPFLRWLNLLLIPFIFSLGITRSSRKAHLYFTHLSEPGTIRQRLVQALQLQGYRIKQDLPKEIRFRSPFFIWNYLLGRGFLHLKEKKKSIQISGSWSKIHQLEKLAHEGEILLPNPK
ncbi:hypothetical protein [Catalinimonas niigatensis]|uniref:hypothetical protein n=1 Tax=Catalinimonas niigatensis TaxID=1397264 RepID=UPI002665A55E|nr:hypothetical protein [Catalinimonas niigatensis]WPP49084.1 hypothetical protein PZB72_20665 [Catalinimonas niigatensis]